MADAFVAEMVTAVSTGVVSALKKRRQRRLRRPQDAAVHAVTDAQRDLSFSPLPRIGYRGTAAQPAAFEPSHAARPSNLAAVLSKAGDRAGALAAGREPVALYRRLARRRPSVRVKDSRYRRLLQLSVTLDLTRFPGQ